MERWEVGREVGEKVREATEGLLGQGEDFDFGSE
jgi:hypothetical protein